MIDLPVITARFTLYKINYSNYYVIIFVYLLFAGWSRGCQRAVDGDRRLRRHDISQDGGGLRPGTELLETLRGHELPETRWWGWGRQDAPARSTSMVAMCGTDSATGFYRRVS